MNQQLQNDLDHAISSTGHGFITRKDGVRVLDCLVHIYPLGNGTCTALLDGEPLSVSPMDMATLRNALLKLDPTAKRSPKTTTSLDT